MATAWGNPAVGGGRARSTATGKKKATEAGSHQSEASRKGREPASWRRRAGNTDPSTRRRHAGTGRGFASVGCVQGPWRSPWQAGAARWGQRSISQGSPSPRGPSTRAQGGRTLRAVGSQACESRHHRRSFRVPSARTQSRGANRPAHRGTAWSGAPGRKRGPAGWSAASIYLPLGGSISSQFRTEEAEAQSGSSCPAGRGWSWNSAAALPLTTRRRCLRHTGTACRRVC